MGYKSISSAERAEGVSFRQELYTRVRDNFENHETRIESLTGSVIQVPSGAIFGYAGASAPTGYLLCDGSAVSRATYSTLFALIGTTFGSGDGSSTFNLPNLSRRIVMGSGGSASGTISNTIGSTGGSETHTLSSGEGGSHTHTGTTGAESASHTHTYSATTSAGGGHSHSIRSSLCNDGGSGAEAYGPGPGGTAYTTGAGGAHTHTYSSTSGAVSASHAHAFTTDAAGSGGAHNNVQPVVVVNFIIKA